MSNKTVSDLRAALFDTLTRLQDAENPMDIDRAKAVSEVAQTIINTAKVEIDFMRATGQQNAGSGFMQIEAGQPTSTGVVTRQIGVDGLPSIVHKMRG